MGGNYHHAIYDTPPTVDPLTGRPAYESPNCKNIVHLYKSSSDNRAHTRTNQGFISIVQYVLKYGSFFGQAEKLKLASNALATLSRSYLLKGIKDLLKILLIHFFFFFFFEGGWGTGLDFLPLSLLS